MTMGKMTALAHNVQVTNLLAECVRVGVVMDDGDILSHYLTSLDTTRFQEVLTEVNTKRTIHVEKWCHEQCHRSDGRTLWW